MIYTTADDKELIEKWNEERDQRAYDELKDRHSGMVHQFINKYKAANVPTAALKAKAWGKFDDAVESYDPSKGAQFSTHLNYQLRKLDRFTKKHQNIGRIPEEKARRIGDLQRVQQELEYEQNEQPTAEDISDRIGWDTDEVEELQNVQRQDLYEGKFEGETLDEDDLLQKADWVLEQARDELSGRELELYDHIIGHDNTRQITSTQELAREFGVSPGRISQMKRSIGKKLKPHFRRHL